MSPRLELMSVLPALRIMGLCVRAGYIVPLSDRPGSRLPRRWEPPALPAQLCGHEWVTDRIHAERRLCPRWVSTRLLYSKLGQARIVTCRNALGRRYYRLAGYTMCYRSSREAAREACLLLGHPDLARQSIPTGQLLLASPTGTQPPPEG